jgi:hypothetical protein
VVPVWKGNAVVKTILEPSMVPAGVSLKICPELMVPSSPSTQLTVAVSVPPAGVTPRSFLVMRNLLRPFFGAEEEGLTGLAHLVKNRNMRGTLGVDMDEHGA